MKRKENLQALIKKRKKFEINIKYINEIFKYSGTT